MYSFDVNSSCSVLKMTRTSQLVYALCTLACFFIFISKGKLANLKTTMLSDFVAANVVVLQSKK